MSLCFAVESLGSMLDEMKILCEQHGDEVVTEALRAEGFLLKPLWGSMLALAQANLLVSFSVRDGADGPLVGYATFVLFPDMHWALSDGSPLLAATTDAHFILKAHRGPRVALRLFELAEVELASRGVRKLSVHIKDHLGNRRFFEALGFAPNDVMMVKILPPSVVGEIGAPAPTGPTDDFRALAPAAE